MVVYVITREESRESPDGWGYTNDFDNCCDDIFLRKEDAIAAMEKIVAFDMQYGIASGYSEARALEEPSITLTDDRDINGGVWIQYRVEERQVIGS